VTTLPATHFAETRALAAQLQIPEIASWLLEEGYYPEQYVLPPCFNAAGFALRQLPYFGIQVNQQGVHKLRPQISELARLSVPKSMLTERAFALTDPRHYHDMVMYIAQEWPLLLNHLFHQDQRIYSYSFPIPLSSEHPGSIGHLRAGRMIYEFLEMAESDLVGEAHRYRVLLRTDVRNFYASVYTHSIPWALQGKASARLDRRNIDSLGKKLDVLAQYSNDQCTNGIPIGPVVSDLLAEIILAKVDLECSARLSAENIDFVGVRFKDDYRFLCESEETAHRIMVLLQQCMQNYSLSLSEEKSECSSLPGGLFRPWKSFYHTYSLARRHSVAYGDFERTLQAVLQFDAQFPGSGIIDRFLSELTTRDFRLKLILSPKHRRSAFSHLMLLAQRRAKAFPVILAIVEAILNQYPEDTDIRSYVEASLRTSYHNVAQRPNENEYQTLWLAYFLKTAFTHQLDEIPDCHNQLVASVVSGQRTFYLDFQDCPMFVMPQIPVAGNHLLMHLAIFQQQQALDQPGDAQ
jgi:hypothetical protein